ncbi:putative protein containing a Zn-finger-like domain containing protein [Desulfocurvibacter africanus PCS]|uniref:Cysteine-rich small domain-containing protein n=1 Tax=Desulfocurvibacter africanus PCS TaxID=1262666 RepID=M5Q0K8_DESAF|nr:cysteine-rich small domain-containing protein [Desulfocurvibacter africanus]EMG35768.1 putative protein containing a Zn-finger-like domain containing protein [Desulfocurvibacter africanus PCS]
MENSHRFFRNAECKYFPCHKVDDDSEFNCLFCFCPLYCLGQACGGDFVMRGGVKDCSKCLVPHRPEGYDHIMKKLGAWFAECRKRAERKAEGQMDAGDQRDAGGE